MRGLIALVALLGMAGAAYAHETHATLTELEFDRTERRLEATLQIPTADLEDELARRVGAAVVLEQSGADSLVAALLGDHFVVRTSDGASLPMRWIGKEVEPRDTWLYFTVDLDREPSALELENTLGMQAHARQVNTVNLKIDGVVRSLVFTRGERRHRLTETAP